MQTLDFQKLLARKMTRKQFFITCISILAALAGITAVLRQLKISADTATTASLQAEAGTGSGVTVVNDASASGGNAIQFGNTNAGGGTITHGEQLTKAMTGYTGLGVTQTSLQQAGDASARVSNWPGNRMPNWLLTTPYVYNNNPANKGGVVPAGGMMIDGFMVPAGTYVVQFLDFSGQQIVVEGSLNGQYGTFAGLMLRGCRWRGSSPYVGLIQENGNIPGGKIWLHYCDMGGLGSQPSQFCEIPVKTNNSVTQVYRCYMSYCTTAVQCVGVMPGNNIIENYIDRLTTFNTDGPHINGVSVNGGDTCYRVERNYIVAQATEDNGSGKSVNQTDCIAFFQDFGSYPGTGTNDDGTVGYRVINNYLGGTGYCIYAGNGTKGAVRNMQLIGNKITTASFPNGGALGPLAADPAWGSNGNVKTNNTWADGPKAGQAAF